MDHAPVKIIDEDLTKYSMQRLQKELEGIQMSLDMLYTKSNSLEGLDISEGGGSPEDYAEWKRLDTAQRGIVKEINRRHMLEAIGEKTDTTESTTTPVPVIEASNLNY